MTAKGWWSRVRGGSRAIEDILVSDGWCVLLLGVTTVLYFWRLVFRGETLYWGDLLLQFYPWRAYAQQNLLANRLPLWNPYVFCGMPFLANHQSAVFYPWNLLSLWLPPQYGLSYGAVVHIFLTGTFMFLFLRQIGCRRFAALVGGVVWMFSGFNITRLQFPSLTYTCTWLPLLLWAQERVWERFSAQRVALLALLVGVQFLAGHAQMSLLGLLLFGLYALYRAVQKRCEGQSWMAVTRVLIGLGIGVGGGGALAALQLLPTYELVLNSPRTQYTYKDVTRFSLPPWQIITILVPDWFGNPARGFYWGGGLYWEVCAYVGLLPLVWAALAVTKRVRGWGFWVGLGITSLALAWGKYAPFYRWAYEYFPLFSLFRDPARFLYWFTFALTTLAALGVNRWQRSAEGEKILAKNFAKLLQFALICVILIMAATVLVPTLTMEYASALVRAVIAQTTVRLVKGQWSDLVLVVWRWAVTYTLQAAGWLSGIYLLGRWLRFSWSRRWAVVWWGVVGLELFCFGSSFNPTVGAAAWKEEVVTVPLGVGPDGLRLYTSREDMKAVVQTYFNPAHFDPSNPELIRHLRRALVPNLNVPYHIPNVQGYDPLPVAVLDRWLWEPAAEEVEIGKRQLMGVGYLWVPQVEPEEEAVEWQQVVPGGKRVWLLPEEEINLGSFPSLELRRVWQEAVGVTPAVRNEVTVVSLPVLITYYSPNAVQLRCPSSTSGRLVLSDTNYPGWQVYLPSGHRIPRELHTVFRTVHIPPRQREISWIYEPISFRLGTFFTGWAVSWLLVVVLLGKRGCSKYFNQGFRLRGVRTGRLWYNRNSEVNSRTTIGGEVRRCSSGCSSGKKGRP